MADDKHTSLPVAVMAELPAELRAATRFSMQLKRQRMRRLKLLPPGPFLRLISQAYPFSGYLGFVGGRSQTQQAQVVQHGANDLSPTARVLLEELYWPLSSSLAQTVLGQTSGRPVGISQMRWSIYGIGTDLNPPKSAWPSTMPEPSIQAGNQLAWMLALQRNRAAQRSWSNQMERIAAQRRTTMTIRHGNQLLATVLRTEPKVAGLLLVPSDGRPEGLYPQLMDHQGQAHSTLGSLKSNQILAVCCCTGLIEFLRQQPDQRITRQQLGL